MKVQLYDRDILIDDFIGEGWFDLSLLLNSPGKTDNRKLVFIQNTLTSSAKENRLEESFWKSPTMAPTRISPRI